MATLESVMVVHWHTFSVQSVEQMRHRVWHHAAAQPSGHAGLVNILPPTTRMPSGRARELLAECQSLAPDNLWVPAALVVQGTGFHTAAVRSVIAGMNMVISQRFPSEVFADIFKAAAWLEQVLREKGCKTVTAEDIVDAAQYLENRICSVTKPQVVLA